MQRILPWMVLRAVVMRNCFDGITLGSEGKLYIIELLIYLLLCLMERDENDPTEPGD